MFSIFTPVIVVVMFPDLPNHPRFNTFLNGQQHSKVSENLSECIETIFLASGNMSVRKFSRLSKKLPQCKENFQIIRKLSRLPGNFKSVQKLLSQVFFKLGLMTIPQLFDKMCLGVQNLVIKKVSLLSTMYL